MRLRSSSEGTGRDRDSFRIGLALHDMVQRMVTARERAARDENLHPTDFGCLGFLYRAGRPVSPKEIISFMGLTSGSATALLDRLEKAGYVHRIPNPDDRRSVLVTLDEERAAVALERYREIAETYREATDRLGDEQIAVIADFLEQMSALAKKAGEGKA